MTSNVQSAPEKKLTPKQLAAIPLLAEGNTVAAAAKQIGVNRKTIDRWKQENDFQEAVCKAEDELYNEALNFLKKTAKAAITCLVRNMDPKQAAPYVQVAAASKLLEQSMEVHKIAALEQEIAELKQLLTVKDTWQQ